MGCPTADVEVDIDMESYDDVTYLWGESVRVARRDRRRRRPVTSRSPNGATRQRQSEAAEVFDPFWTWLAPALRRRCEEQGRTFAAYCFWAQAEDGAMNRAVRTPLSRWTDRR